MNNLTLAEIQACKLNSKPRKELIKIREEINLKTTEKIYNQELAL